MNFVKNPKFLVVFCLFSYSTYFLIGKLFFDGNFPVLWFLSLIYCAPIAMLKWPRIGFFPFAMSHFFMLASTFLPIAIRPLFESDIGTKLLSSQIAIFVTSSIINLIGFVWLINYGKHCIKWRK